MRLPIVAAFVPGLPVSFAVVFYFLLETRALAQATRTLTRTVTRALMLTLTLILITLPNSNPTTVSLSRARSAAHCSRCTVLAGSLAQITLFETRTRNFQVAFF